ncbi:hypothetical protein M406DRAFT_270539 [Cryphonectria parasitica EP155]|uniref:WW domain-containing protein n=1 Tax=Cryphonectria parasitica (strain ATCC 38755 / EP155) TaxID=660469 RepID=A0A9P5CTY6_CRYP1|nr:uncharacterized protein M406DRAFT_270539 [Cryphonectria parasitica EP155]KAF3769595.1 hypothetical protein M406DRAFT_270539 [Cryphonectria parasitica EP155]
MPSDSDAAATPLTDDEEKQQLQRSPSPADSRSEEGEARSDDSPPRHEEQEEEGDSNEDPQHGGDTSFSKQKDSTDAPPLPDEPLPGQAPPLPSEAPPENADDGWEAKWDAANSAWYFYNRFTGVSQWDNPRVPTSSTGEPAGISATGAPGTSTTAAATAISQPTSVAGGYNPAIHGDWDPNAPYAQAYKAGDEEYEADLAAYNAEAMAGVEGEEAGDPSYLQNVAFNKGTGKFQTGDQNPEKYTDANKSYRQMNAYFNVDQAANSHDGRSLKAERRGKQPTRKELAMWKEKRKARKEEKRRAWLRD